MVRTEGLFLLLPGVAAHRFEPAVAAAAALLMAYMIGALAAAPAVDVCLAAAPLAHAGRSFYHDESTLAEVLRRRDEDDGIAPDEHNAEPARDLAVDDLFSILKHSIDVYVERLERPAVAFSVLQFYDDPLVPCVVQRVQWP